MYLPEWEMTFHLLKGSIYLINYQRKGMEGKGFPSQVSTKELGRDETNSLATHKWGKSGPCVIPKPKNPCWSSGSRVSQCLSPRAPRALLRVAAGAQVTMAKPKDVLGHTRHFTNVPRKLESQPV